jgi:hypothetical protein
MRLRGALFLFAVVACGSRTGLLVPPPAQDATAPDVAADVAEEPDVVEEPDAVLEAEADAGEEDAPPMIEETVDICPDAGSTLVYVMTSDNVLMSFYPPTATFTTIGTIQCPDPGTEGNPPTPFSMAVDRAGIAYVLFESGHVYRVSTRTAVCVPTTFVPGQAGFPLQFGMGFAANVSADGGGDAGGDGGETLYIGGDPGWGTNMPGPSMLGALDTASYAVTNIGPFVPVILQPELTGTGAGQLYGFWAATDTSDTSIVQIDKGTEAVTTLVTLPGVYFGAGWAFAFWGGDFYTFTAPTRTSSIVTRYRPSDGSIVQVATTAGLVIVGAGVSTCAPQM